MSVILCVKYNLSIPIIDLKLANTYYTKISIGLRDSFSRSYMKDCDYGENIFDWRNR